ncbi:hypothetical protein RUND412_003863 [Rhizina undulata]
MHLLKSISSSVSGNPDEGVSVRSGMQFMIPISWTQEIASARNGLNVPIKEYQGPDDVFWHPKGAPKAALVVPKASESLNGPDSLVDKPRKTSSADYHRKLHGEYWDFRPSYCGSVRNREHMKRTAMLYSGKMSESEYESSITSPLDVSAASGKRSELAFENGEMEDTSESEKNAKDRKRRSLIMGRKVEDAYGQEQSIQSESDDNGTVCFWIADCLLPASKPNNAASLDSDIFKMRERKAREYLAEHRIYEAESKCSINSLGGNGTPCFRIADCLLPSPKMNKAASPNGDAMKKQALRTRLTRENLAEYGLHQQESGSSTTSLDNGTVCFWIADCLPPRSKPNNATSSDSEIDKMRELKAQEYLAEKGLHEAKSECSTLSSDGNQEDISKTWSRPSGGQLENLTGSKIGFGERILAFIDSLNPDSSDAPKDPPHVFYPPTRRYDPAKTPLPFDPEVFRREPKFSWEAGGRVWPHSTAWEYDFQTGTSGMTTD